MKTVKYEEEDKGSGGTETHVAVDEAMKRKSRPLQEALEEGFAASDGIRGVTSASGGKIKHPEKSDAAAIDPLAESIENENPGLADN